MIPQAWFEQHGQLALKQHAQRERMVAAARAQMPFMLDEGETLVTDETFAALDATPVTIDELAQLADLRGHYREGDTRGFVLTQEDACMRYNCWMTRDKNGAVAYVSEAPSGT